MGLNSLQRTGFIGLLARYAAEGAESAWKTTGFKLAVGIVVVASMITGDKLRSPRFADFHLSLGDFLTARRL